MRTIETNMKQTETSQTWYAKDGQIIEEGTGKTIAILTYFDKEDEEQQRQQKLLAAAPELLEQCQRMLNLIECNKQLMKNYSHVAYTTRSVISKTI